MSRLSQALNVEKGKRSDNFDFLSITDRWDRLPPETYIYRVYGEFSASFVVNENASAVDDNAFTEAVRYTKQAIIEELYGEFRDPLVRIRHAAFNRDYETVVRLSESILSEMFESL